MTPAQLQHQMKLNTLYVARFKSPVPSIATRTEAEAAKTARLIQRAFATGQEVPGWREWVEREESGSYI